MKTASPYRELIPSGATVPVRFDGTALMLPEGENLAAALLVAGILPFRHTPVSGAPRGPFCMMGACYDCLVQLDGRAQQACMLRVVPDMEIAMPPAGEARNA
ncbi:(2Fe-2S)-binding protein [Roseovarius sp. S1116L3]|uniref:(2Fe-2S)-binding protein n=1 Tax=Roseovarius roseus TaxID=3342636 RepID=UPI00372A0BBF